MEEVKGFEPLNTSVLVVFKTTSLNHSDTPPYLKLLMQLARKIKNLTELEKLSEILLPYLQPNIYLILQGELGVGKTTLAQLIAKKMGIKEKITSPTFNILQRYQIKDNYYLNHFDFFRLNTNDNLEIFQELAIDNLNIIE